MTSIDVTRCDNCGLEEREPLAWRMAYTGRYFVEDQKTEPMDFCSWPCVKQYASRVIGTSFSTSGELGGG